MKLLALLALKSDKSDTRFYVHELPKGCLTMGGRYHRHLELIFPQLQSPG